AFRALASRSDFIGGCRLSIDVRTNRRRKGVRIERGDFSAARYVGEGLPCGVDVPEYAHFGAEVVISPSPRLIAVDGVSIAALARGMLKRGSRDQGNIRPDVEAVFDIRGEGL